jgi:hypothetical protein
MDPRANRGGRKTALDRLTHFPYTLQCSETQRQTPLYDWAICWWGAAEGRTNQVRGLRLQEIIPKRSQAATVYVSG